MVLMIPLDTSYTLKGELQGELPLKLGVQAGVQTGVQALACKKLRNLINN
jgi:hypothetical protein